MTKQRQESVGKIRCTRCSRHAGAVHRASIARLWLEKIPGNRVGRSTGLGDRRNPSEIKALGAILWLDGRNFGSYTPRALHTEFRGNRCVRPFLLIIVLPMMKNL